ncbi:MAG TPA: hypothetical protein VFA35_09725, partial [Burkholderiaceae bacterium]|nr:hypothetical protein [Burkholderiaceae bacterium]
MRHWFLAWLGAQLATQLATQLAAQLAAQVPSPLLSGRVVDEQGAPLAGVAVCLLDENPGAPLFVTADLLQEPLARTAADGTWSAALPAAVHGVGMRLLLVAPGRVHVAAPLHSHDGWPVALPRAHTLAGRVVDTDGRPLAGVRVAARDWLCDARYRADNQRVPWLPEPLTAVLTDDGGRFVLPGTVGAG